MNNIPLKTENSVKFLHIADTHLGYRQYNLAERYHDYNKSFDFILNKAIEEKVHFILIAGDIFNNNRLDPTTLSDAYKIITNFKQKALNHLQREIPIIAIEGNHDQTRYGLGDSWLDFLANLELIKLLKSNYDENNKNFDIIPYNNCKGGVISIGNVNIFGLPVYGSNTEELIPRIADSIKQYTNESNTFNILMMHFGIEGEVGRKIGIPLTDKFTKLHESVDYLALGHFHKQYVIPKDTPWIFNPGSLEIVDAKERFEDYPRGAFIITLTSENTADKPKINFKKLSSFSGPTDDPNEIPNRDFFSLTAKLNPKLNNFDKVKEFLSERLLKFGIKQRNLKDGVNTDLKTESLDYKILLISLTGIISFSKLDLNINKLRQFIKENFEILEARIYSHKVLSDLDDFSVTVNKPSTREEIEKIVFEKLIDKHVVYNIEKKNLYSLLTDLKESIILKNSPENWAELISVWWSNHESKFNDLEEKYGVEEKKKIIKDNEDISSYFDSLKEIQDMGIPTEDNLILPSKVDHTSHQETIKIDASNGNVPKIIEKKEKDDEEDADVLESSGEDFDDNFDWEI